MTANTPWTPVRFTDDAPCPCAGAARRATAVLSDAGRAGAELADAVLPGAPESPPVPAVPRYGDCCAPLHRRERAAATAVELMCARYSAYAAHEADYLWMTWHPRRRPEAITFEPDVEWLGLDIVDVVDGAAGDREGIVEFRARYRDAEGPAELWERSSFVLRAKRWMYVDGEFR